MDIEPLLRQYAWNLAYAQALTRDVPPELWARSGGPGLENHPAWTIGHLVTGSALVAEDFGHAFALPATWRELFLRAGPNDPTRPREDADAYPDRATLMEAYENLHGVVASAARAAEAQSLAVAVAWRFDGYLPTGLDALVFMLIAHEGVHLGQLGCWRRRFDLPSAMASMARGPAAAE